MMVQVLLFKTAGSFGIDDGDGSEYIPFKMNKRFSNIVAFIPIRWKCLM